MRAHGHVSSDLGAEELDARAIELRELESMSELRPLEGLQREVWGIDDLEVVPASAMRAVVHAGGLVVGALAAGEPIGFAFGFASTPHGRGMNGPGLHSHMAAVRPAFRRQGVGRRLKRYQANWCAARGLRWISWTFDPLRAENAHFNLAVLGARCHDYLEDFYGPMPGTLGGGIESDRLLAVWPVPVADRGDARAGAAGGGAEAGHDEAARPAGGATAAPQRVSGPRDAARDRAAALGSELWLLPPGDEPQVPGAAALERALTGPGTLRVASPPARLDVFSRPELARAWRAAQRSTLKAALDRGWVAAGFAEGSYVLERSGEPEPQRL